MIEKVTNFNDKNIEHLKIYFDGYQFRFKLKCAVCGKKYHCMCYDTIEEAYEESKLRFLCDEHSIKEMGIDYINIIDNVLNTKYEKYLIENNFSKKSMKLMKLLII